MLVASPVTSWLHYAPDQAIYVRLFGAILCLDAWVEIPFAKWRLEGRALAFAGVRLVGISVNIGANLFFLVVCPWLAANGHGWVFRIWDPTMGIGYIFFSNLLASLLVFLVLLPGWVRLPWRPDIGTWRKMLGYSAPLVLVSLAGIVNETIDRELLKLWLPGTVSERLAQVGIYSAAYKLAMFMSLFTQAFRYAAEPFFFKQARHADARDQYALVTRYFSLAGAVAFLVVTLYLDLFQYFIGPAFREGLVVVPILLMANLALGLYYNLSIWYKLTDKTHVGAWIALAGAALTLMLNAWLIPRMGYVGSAWATLSCYAAMTLACWWWGRKHYPVPYDWRAIGRTVGGALLLYGCSRLMAPVWTDMRHRLLFHTILLSGFLIMALRPLRIWRSTGGSV
jgi:O-antigen/teichoic acid export membrane protein